jgi:hypothetical protein
VPRSPPGTERATARDIDEDGTTVGTVDDERPYVWFPDGTHRELPMPDLDGEPAATARVSSIRNGWATGLATDGSGRDGSKPSAESKAPAARTTVVRWNVRTGEVRATAGMNLGATFANAHGWQVGVDKKGRAVLVTDAGVLPDPAGHEPGGLPTSRTP